MKLRRIFVLAGTLTCPLGGEQDSEFIWSGMMGCYIGWLTALEISASFQSVSSSDRNYINRVAVYLGISQWECRRLYLMDTLTNRREQSSVDVNECWIQLKLINDFLKMKKSYGQWSTSVETAYRLMRNRIRFHDAVGLDLY